jgi:hypothetical protein
MKKLICIFALLLTLISCSESENDESSVCKGKTVERITESYSSSIIYFTDGTYYEVYSPEWELISTSYHKAE